jgi:competence protein ComEA
MSSNWVKEYLSFTKKERVGIITLIVFILVIYLFPLLLPPKFTAPTAKEVAEFSALAKAFKADSSHEEINSRIYYSKEPAENKSIERKLFEFDPNKISEKEWRRLGLPDRTIHTIINYISKGGQFRKPEDLQKIYGLPANDYRLLKPYVRIESAADHSSYNRRWNDSAQHAQTSSNPHIERKPDIPMVELNSADTSDLIRLRGIGSKLATRIINFRDKLGGFVSIDQVGETYGLRDSVFQAIKPFLILGDREVKKININTADANTLKSHPYIPWADANAIVAYRVQHGPFSKVDDINKIPALNADQIKRLIPYLSTY